MEVDKFPGHFFLSSMKDNDLCVHLGSYIYCCVYSVCIAYIQSENHYPCTS